MQERGRKIQENAGRMQAECRKMQENAGKCRKMQENAGKMQERCRKMQENRGVLGIIFFTFYLILTSPRGAQNL
jgi:hypothetical protein